MIARGHVKNGVIVLDDNVRLQDGEEVSVQAHGGGPASAETGPLSGHSILEIPTVNAGAVLRPLNSDDDLLGEMLEGR